MSDSMLFSLLLALLAGYVVLAFALWLRAEKDERRWRRALKEEQDRVLIREARYGSSKKGKL